MLADLKRDTGSLRSSIYKYRSVREDDERAQAWLEIDILQQSVSEVLAAIVAGSDDLELDPVDDERVVQGVERARELFGELAASIRRLRQGIDELSAEVAAHNAALPPLLQTIDEATSASDEKATGTIHWFQRTQTGVLVVGLLISLATLRFLMVAVIRPLRRTRDALMSVSANNDLTTRLDAGRTDELGELAEAFNDVFDKLQASMQTLRERSDTIRTAARSLDGTAEDLQSGVELTRTESDAVATAASDLLGQMTTVGQSADSMRSQIGIVMDRVREMRHSIGGVVARVESAAQVAAGAAKLAASSDSRMQQLGSAAGSVGRVIETIQDIAEQTNLLALNATIEASRAGEAGKGFAVVANEVKELARATQLATEQIRAQITEIQTSSHDAVATIKDIGAIVGKIDGSSSGIAASVSEQHTATADVLAQIESANEFVGGVAQSAGNTVSAGEIILRNINAVGDQSARTAEGATATRRAGGSLSALADELGVIVDQFRIGAPAE